MTANGEDVTATEREPWPFDDEFGLCVDPCEHPSINGNTCAACGEEVEPEYPAPDVVSAAARFIYGAGNGHPGSAGWSQMQAALTGLADTAHLYLTRRVEGGATDA